MKKTYFLVILTFLTCLSLKAQTEKGKFILGGTINPEFNKKRTNFEGNPFFPLSIEKWNELNISSNIKGGYFFINNLVVGLNINGNYSHTKYLSNAFYRDNTTSINLSGGPFLRGYPIKNESFGFFIEGGGNIGVGKNSYDYSRIKNKYKSTQLNAYLGPGINYFITEKVGIELSLFYSYSKEENRYPSNYISPSDYVTTYIEKRTSKIHQINAMIGINLFL